MSWLERKFPRREFLVSAGALTLAGALASLKWSVDNYVAEQVSEGNILFLNGGKIKVNFGINLLTEDEKGNISELSYLPGTAHPDLTVSNPIIVLPKKEQEAHQGTLYRFFYRSFWRLVPIEKAPIIKDPEKSRNAKAVGTKTSTDPGKPAELILKDGKIVEQKVVEEKS